MFIHINNIFQVCCLSRRPGGREPRPPKVHSNALSVHLNAYNGVDRKRNGVGVMLKECE